MSKLTAKGLANWKESNTSPTARTLKVSALRPGAVALPFKHIPRDEYLKIIDGQQIPKRTHEAEIQRVKLNSVQGIQRTVNQERLHAYIENPNMTPSGKRAIGSGMLVDKPVIVKVGDAMYLHDGHTRATAAYMRGEAEIEARVVELS